VNPNSELRSESTDDDLLAELVEEYTTRLQNGESLNWSQFVAAHPERAAGLRQLLPAVHLLAGAGSSDAVTNCAPPENLLDSPNPLLGDYRIIREIGRGGMGIVYEARQLSMDRLVAVKVLPAASHLDSRQLRRFQIEAQAAAGLHHAHIVRVFDVGCDQGTHYYAMQLIDGLSLDQWLWSFQSRYGEQIHTGGTSVDISAEPSPLLRTTLPDTDLRIPVRTVVKLAVQAARALEHAHQQGIVHRDIKPGNLLVNQQHDHLWITDFGLARCQGDSDLTRTGDLLGTLRYMSPEQALARPGLVDHRTDIYALGATLYELLTLRPVFPGETRQELLRQVADQEPLPIRRHDSELPVEIETIVLKALAKNPAERYATAQDLADDLQCFLDSRPIRARRPSAAEWVMRWGKRHRSLVVAGALAAGVLFLAQSISMLVIYNQRNEARGLEETARSAVDDMYVSFVQDWLSQKPLLETEQRDLLMKALHFYEGFARDSGTEPAERFRVARAQHSVADIQAKLGETALALEAYQLALEQFESLRREGADLPHLQSALAGCWNDLGNLRRDANAPDAAKLAFRTARVLYARQVSSHPEDATAWAGLAGCSVNLGAVLARDSEFQEADSLLNEAIGIDQHWFEATSRTPVWRYNLATAMGNLAELRAGQATVAKAEKLYGEALEHLSLLALEFPERLVYRQALINSRCGLAALLTGAGELVRAEEHYREAIVATQKLVVDFPRVPAFKLMQSSIRTRLAQVMRSRGETTASAALLREILGQLKSLKRGDLKPFAIEREQAACELGLAECLETHKAHQEAEQRYRTSARLAEQILQADANQADMLWLRGQAAARLGKLLFIQGQLGQAKEWLGQALTIKQHQADTHPSVAGYQADLAWTLLDCWEPAFRDTRAAVTLAERATELRPRDADAWLVRGATLYRAGRWREAATALEESRRLNRSTQTVASYYLALSYQKLNRPSEARAAMVLAEQAFARRTSNDRTLSELREEAREALARLSGLPAEHAAKERTKG
jgi:serine/threonine protein kinase